jgi:hypothetical protein
MIDIGKILKRAWHILWNYRVLWIFGILLALTVGSAGGASSSSGYQFSGNNNYNWNNGYNPKNPPSSWLPEVNAWVEQNIVPLISHSQQYVSTLIWIGIGIFLFFIIVGVIAAFLRYVSETAIIRMVDDYEQTGTMIGGRQGWKLGWSRRAFRMWVIDLIISLPAILFLALLVGLGVLFFISVTNNGQPAAIAGAIFAIGCAFIFIFAFILLMVFLGLLRKFFVRAAALDNTGIRESFQHGWQIFRGNWKSAGLMWLVMVGIGIGYNIAGIILLFVLIPVFIITGVAGLIVAALPGLVAFGITSIFAGGPLAWIIAILVALPFFLLILGSPMLLIGGWMQIFTSSVWTLAYREMKALQGIPPAEIPAKTG